MDNGQNGASLEALVQQIVELRPLPACTLRILEITEAEQFSAHDLATTIASDQTITATLLRLANSAYYGFPRRITTVRDAVVLLGFREVRAATIVASLIDGVPDSSNVDYEAFCSSRSPSACSPKCSDAQRTRTAITRSPPACCTTSDGSGSIRSGLTR